MVRYSEKGQVLVELVFLIIVFGLIFVFIESAPLTTEKEMSHYEFAQHH